MRRAIVGALMLAVVAATTAETASAGGSTSELPFAITGQVREINQKQALVRLSDGTQLFALNARQLDGIREGAMVQVSGEERFGKKIILRIEAVPR